MKCFLKAKARRIKGVKALGTKLPALLSRREMNKNVFASAQEGQNLMQTLQGAKSKENTTYHE